MTILITVSTALTIALLIFLVAELVPGRSAGVVKDRMVDMGLGALASKDRMRRARQRSKLKKLLRYVGDHLETRHEDWSSLRHKLIHAGYRDSSAVAVYLGIRFTAMVGLGLYGFVLGGAADVSGAFPIFLGLLGVAAGWIIPRFILASKVTRRQKEIQKALPDASDLLVICVEAGLGLNQALVRVSEEMRHQSKLFTEELTLMNMAIRAGTPRERALTDWAMRTGVDDVRSLATMLVQTERFGTSIAHSLRVHSESMRAKRRQRAEEAAAKTTIKMIFPLALCIFPAMFVVILGPAFISIFQTFASL
ncbi:MAG: type II secretion system F family protein [Longimicrobiales bacterium]|nr:type II secretion system F family protein [Longimicrobiales bacterium]